MKDCKPKNNLDPDSRPVALTPVWMKHFRRIKLPQIHYSTSVCIPVCSLAPFLSAATEFTIIPRWPFVVESIRFPSKSAWQSDKTTTGETLLLMNATWLGPKLQNRKKVDLELRLVLSTAVDAVGQFYHQTVCSRFRAHLYVQFSSLHHLNVRLTQCIQSVNALNSCHNRKPSAVQRAAPDSHSADAAPQQGADTATLGRPFK